MDYTEYDYQTLVEHISQRLGMKEGWGEGFDSSTGQMLIQLFADSTDALLYMLERRVQEAFISTAVLETSIFAHASELGYRPRRVVANTGTLRLDLKDQQNNPTSAAADIRIPKFTRITLPDPRVEFVTTEECVIEAGDSTIEIPVKEGRWIRRQFSTDEGSLSETNDIVFNDYRMIDEYSIVVDDNGEKYYDVEQTGDSTFNFGALSYAKKDDPVYDVKYSIEGMRIIFGDGIFGKKPDGTVTLNFVRSEGQVSPILATGIKFKFDNDTITDTSNTIPQNTYRYDLTNITPIRGYKAPETILEIAENAPEYARANSRGVTNSDFQFWGMRSGIGGIADIISYGEQESGSLIYNMNNVNLTYITEDAQPFNVEQEELFRSFMNRYKTATTHLIVDPAKHIDVVLTVQFKKESRAPISNEELYKVLKEDIENYFKIGRDTIGGNLQHSELVEYIQNLTHTINGITYNITDFVKVDIQPQYELPDSYNTYDVRIYLDNSYTFVENDVWTVTIDGTDISVTVSAGETKETLLEKMRVAISSQTPLLTAINDFNGEKVIRIRSNYIDTTFDISIPVGDVSSFTSTDKLFKIPSSTLFNESGDNVVVPGTCHIVDSNENIIFNDNGSGTLVNTSTGNDIGIDYTTCELLDPYIPDTNETYYFRFQQDAYQNVQASKESAIILSDFAETIFDPDLFSTIEIL